MWEQDDFPSYEFDPKMDVPRQISFRARFFLEFINQPGFKFWDAIGLLQVWTHKRENTFGASVEFNAQVFTPIFYIMDAADVTDFRKQKDNYNRENLLRKWNSVCFSTDFSKKDHTCQVSWNGQLSEEELSVGNAWRWNYGTWS